MLSTQCYASRRTFFERVGGWDERIKRWQDWIVFRHMIILCVMMWVILRLLRRVIVCRQAKIREDPLVTIRVHKDSITGNGYLHSSTALEEAVLLTAETVSKGEVEDKEQVVASIYGRFPILAAHYRREGGKEASRKALSLYFEKVKLSLLQKIIIYTLFIYTIFGGRGGGRIINKMKVKLN